MSFHYLLASFLDGRATNNKQTNKRKQNKQAKTKTKQNKTKQKTRSHINPDQFNLGLF